MQMSKMRNNSRQAAEYVIIKSFSHYTSLRTALFRGSLPYFSSTHSHNGGTEQAVR